MSEAVNVIVVEPPLGTSDNRNATEFNDNIQNTQFQAPGSTTEQPIQDSCMIDESTNGNNLEPDPQLQLQDPNLAQQAPLNTDPDLSVDQVPVVFPNGHNDNDPGFQEEGKASIAIQANDYEIERRSGVLPARRRIIPFKFRDFHDPDVIPKEESDDDYEPGEGTAKRTRRKTGRGPGRPKKSRMDHAYEKSSTENMDGQNNGTEGQKQDGENQQGNDEMMPRRGRPPKDFANPAPKMYKCLQCARKFSQKGNLKVHMRTHTGERPFKCDMPECTRQFRSNESLKRHKLAHLGIKLFECEICKERFSSNVALKEHSARHTDTKTHQCPHCQRWFRQISCMRRHLITHFDEKPFSCDVCGQRFSQKVYLRSHQRMHSGEKPFECPTCNKRFSHHSDLNRHKTVHSGEKPFVCEVCGARFSDPSSRRRHVKEHSGMKVYTCQLCGDSFKRSGQLKAHLNKKHMNYKEEVMITKVGPFNALQFEFKQGQKYPVVVEGQTEEAAGAVEVVTDAERGLPQVQLVSKLRDMFAQQQQQQQQQVRQPQSLLQPEVNIPQQVDVQQAHTLQQAQPVPDQQLAQLQVVGETAVNQYDQAQLQEDVGSGGNQPQLVPNQIILASSTSGQDKEQLLEETQHIIQQIQCQLEQRDSSGQGESKQVQVAYQIIHDDESQQIVEIQYHPVEALAEEGQGQGQGQVTEPAPEAMETPAAAMEMTQDAQQQQQQQPPPNGTNTEESNNQDATSNVDYVQNPDFNSQEYYNWLSNFTELCKLMPMPLDVDLFQKISQVHKTLSDVLATPKGILTNKENFRTLMNISQELNGIINEHLAFVLQNLEPGEQLHTE